MHKIQSLKGTADYWPTETALWQKVEKIMISTVQQWGYAEVRTPILEPEAVFIKMGTDSDVVGKQMYRIVHDKEAIVLRPEGTSSIVRSGLEHHKILRDTAKIWYLGPMFRHERPQKGRLREFHQFGAECFGYGTVDADIDMLDMLCTLMHTLGLTHRVTLEINTLGSTTSRKRYKQALVDYLTPLYELLDTDSQRRLLSNPLRIFDSKVPATQSLMQNAPLLHDYLTDEESLRHTHLLAQLDTLGHAYTINPRLVRGLDYYNDLVFEFTTQELGAQGTVCAGGRFDCLTEQWGYAAVPAVGFSIGMERLLALLEHTLSVETPDTIIAFTSISAAHIPMLKLLKALREIFPGIVHYDVSASSFKNKYTRAMKASPRAILIIEEAHHTHNTISIRRPGHMPQECAMDPKEIINACLTT